MTRATIGASVVLACMSCAASAAAEEASAIATYHSLGLYWNADGGGADRLVSVRYRQGSGEWQEGLPMRWNPISGTEEDLASYRGSLVELEPGTRYEVELSLDGTDEGSTIFATTWSEVPPEGTVISVGDSSSTLEVSESGTADSYVVYDGGGATIDVALAEDNAIEIDASYVIIRNMVLRGALDNGIRILGGHDIIIEDMDISAWGSLDFDGDFGQNSDAGVYSSDSELTRVVVQRCRIHHPNHDTNNWQEPNCHGPDACSNHPAGPQTIIFFNSAGNHVIRYNELFTDREHYFNDVVGAGSNGSYVGFPGHDSDIYGNYVANSWDDGIEAEGGNRNVRIWGNYVEHTFIALANAATSIGPLYIWRNVSGQCWETPDEGGAYFVKMGYAGAESWMTGHMYLFHNTILNVDDMGCGGLGGSSRYIHHAVTRNNVLHVRSDSSHSISTRSENSDNDFDYDLYSATVPEGHEAHGISGSPLYSVGSFDGDTMTGDFALLSTSPGFDDGVPIPGFNDDFQGAAPDMGAHEAGAPPPRYGLAAAEPLEPCEPVEEICGNGRDDDCDGLVDEGCGLQLRVPRATTAPSIDGDLADLAEGATLSLQGDRAEAVVYASWDDDHLYVGYDVIDTDVRGHVAAGEDGDVWRDDAVELYVDPLLDGGSELRADDQQIIVSARGASYQTFEGSFERAERVEGTLGDDEVDVGFRVELAIPWARLGVSPAAGLSMGADFVVDDRDAPDDGGPSDGVYETVDWAGLTTYAVPGSWGTMILVDDEAPADGGPDADPWPDGDVPQPDGGALDGSPDGGGGDQPSSGCGCRADGAPRATVLTLAALGATLLLARRRR